MSETVAVLAVDALDYRLARRWECDHLLLDQAQPLATFGSERHDGWPLTLDVWPAVARGERRDGAVGHGWQDDRLQLLSRLVAPLPDALLTRLGRLALALGAGAAFTSDDGDDADHLFAGDGRAYTNWPGLDEAARMRELWDVIEAARAGDVGQSVVSAAVHDDAVAASDWLQRQHERGVALAGTHCHSLDLAGHVWAQDRAALRREYERVDRVVGRLRATVGELVVLSDHGMQVSWLDDPHPAEHSFDALVARTDGLDGLPDTVLEVRHWLDGQVAEPEAVNAAVSREQLEALGYVEPADDDPAAVPDGGDGDG